MAIVTRRDDGEEWLNSKYEDLLIKPMGRDGGPIIHTEHIVDAGLVAAIVFFAVILGDVLMGGFPAYITLSDIATRLPTAIIAFFLTFFFQWARSRGIDVLGRLRDVLG